MTWVPGTGNREAKWAVVGEAPGSNEMREGRGFVGSSGQVLWPWLWRITGLQRRQFWVTNWKKTPMEKGDKKLLEDPAEREPWTEALLDELGELPNLRYIISLGAWATDALLPGVNNYWGNGLAFDAGRWTVIPVVHPAAGLHDSEMLARTWHGLRGVRRFLDTGELRPTEMGDDGTDWVLTTPQDLANMLEGHTVVAIDTEGSKEKPFCLSVSTVRGAAVVVYAGDEPMLEEVRRYLKRERPLVVMHNALHDIDVLATVGIEIDMTKIRDTMVEAYVLQDLPKDLKNLTQRLLGIPMTPYKTLVGPYQAEAEKTWRAEVYARAVEDLDLEQQFTPKGRPKMSGGHPVYKVVGPQVNLQIKKHFERNQQYQLQEEKWAETHVRPKPGLDLALVPADVHVPYAGKDARVTLELAPLLRKRIREEKLEEVSELDHAVIPMIHSMQSTGLYLDLERYHEVMAEISVQRRETEAQLKELIGADFNPGSSDQVERALREHEYELTKRTKSGKRFSTDNNVLRILKERYQDTEFLDKLLLYRELAKYEDTYMLPLGQLATKTSGGFRLFSQLRTTTVVSGRLSAHSPNVLAWPARTALGLKLRSIFVAPPGKVLVSWDLSQIELRLAAAFSKDPVMTEAFLQGRDLHANLASKIFGVDYESCLVDPGKFQYRYPSKLIHYLLLYGGMGNRLYEELRGAGVTGYTLEDCGALIETTWATYAGAGRYLREKTREAKQHGYVRDWLGRRRFLPGTWLEPGRFGWAIRGPKLEAERQAGNHDIQAGAAEIIKRAMVRALEVQERTSLRLWLQIHDELMGELDEDDWEKANAWMVNAMTADSDITAPIPILTEGVRGEHWGALK